jgi:ATP phosphoribosyltransferase
MSPDLDAGPLRIALPKGRMQPEVFALLDAAGLGVRSGARAYRPALAAGRFDAKLLKPQNIVEMLAAGSRDIGFAGADWVAELRVDLVELLDTGLDPVRLVAAAPLGLLQAGGLPATPLRLATEYPRLAAQWINDRGLDARVIRSFGATEVFPPDDADLIVDNTASGATLAANGLEIVDTLLHSSTRLYGSAAAMDDPMRRAAIGGVVMLLASVIDARERVMLEVNVSEAALEAVCFLLPCMREPTIATLHGNAGYAVKAAVPRRSVASVIPRVKAAGGSDVVITPIAQIVP